MTSFDDVPAPSPTVGDDGPLEGRAVETGDSAAGLGAHEDPAGSTDIGARGSWRRRDRSHDGPPRTVRVLLRVTRAQLSDLDAAARSCGLTVSGFAADAAVAAASGEQSPVSEPLRAALADLVDARTQLRELAANVHLAVAAYHRKGVPPTWLRAAVEDSAAAVARVDAAAEAIVRSLR